jgi:hypothetical protein
MRIRRMQPPCLHCDEPDATSIRLALMTAIYCTDETMLALLTDLLNQSGLLAISEQLKAPRVQRQKDTLLLAPERAQHQESHRSRILS